MIKATISRERGEGDPHDLRSLCTKAAGRSVHGFRTSAPGPYSRPSEPLQEEAVWGKTQTKKSRNDFGLIFEHFEYIHEYSQGYLLGVSRWGYNL